MFSPVSWLLLADRQDAFSQRRSCYGVADLPVAAERQHLPSRYGRRSMAARLKQAFHTSARLNASPALAGVYRVASRSRGDGGYDYAMKKLAAHDIFTETL